MILVVVIELGIRIVLEFLVFFTFRRDKFLDHQLLVLLHLAILVIIRLKVLLLLLTLGAVILKSLQLNIGITFFKLLLIIIILILGSSSGAKLIKKFLFPFVFSLIFGES